LPPVQIQKPLTDDANGSSKKSIARIKKEETIMILNLFKSKRINFEIKNTLTAIVNHEKDIATGTPNNAGRSTSEYEYEPNGKPVLTPISSAANDKIRIMVQKITDDFVSAASLRNINVTAACRPRKILVVHKYCFPLSPESIIMIPTGSITTRIPANTLITLFKLF
jgi:hypothetical protein